MLGKYLGAECDPRTAISALQTSLQLWRSQFPSKRACGRSHRAIKPIREQESALLEALSGARVTASCTALATARQNTQRWWQCIISCFCVDVTSNSCVIQSPARIACWARFKPDCCCQARQTSVPAGSPQVKEVARRSRCSTDASIDHFRDAFKDPSDAHEWPNMQRRCVPRNFLTAAFGSQNLHQRDA